MISSHWGSLLHLLGDLRLRLQNLAQHFGLVAMKVSTGVMGGGGGRSPLPDSSKLLGVLRVDPTT
jgi:hypothetical protein